MSIFSDDKCPKCGTTATYELSPNNFGCKCTYEFETDIELGKQLERARIIELLENSTLSSINKLIAIPLIKGELE